MAYVRRLVSQQSTNERIIRVYEVETPRWYAEWLLEVDFPKLVDLELHISPDCAHYFRKVPYSLAEIVWVRGLRSYCCKPFCCSWDFEILYYPIEPEPRMVTHLEPFHDRPIVLDLGLNTGGYPSMLLS